MCFFCQADLFFWLVSWWYRMLLETNKYSGVGGSSGAIFCCLKRYMNIAAAFFVAANALQTH